MFGIAAILLYRALIDNVVLPVVQKEEKEDVSITI